MRSCFFESDRRVAKELNVKRRVGEMGERTERSLDRLQVVANALDSVPIMVLSRARLTDDSSLEDNVPRRM